MTCLTIGRRTGDKLRGFLCISDVYRLHVCEKYIWMEWHEYLGPTFYLDRACTREVVPDDDFPIWEAFDAWHKKHTEAK